MDVIYKAQQQQLELAFSSKADLIKSHMPFVKQVGLFVPGNFSFKMGETINLDLKLLFIKKEINMVGKVVWVIPKNDYYQQAGGIGIQFDLSNFDLSNFDPSNNEINDNRISTELLPLFS